MGSAKFTPRGANSSWTVNHLPERRLPIAIPPLRALSDRADADPAAHLERRSTMMRSAASMPCGLSLAGIRCQGAPDGSRSSASCPRSRPRLRNRRNCSSAVMCKNSLMSRVSSAIGDQHPFEVVDLFVGPMPFGRTGEALDALSSGSLRLQQRVPIARRDTPQHFADRRKHRERRADLPSADVRVPNPRRLRRRASSSPTDGGEAAPLPPFGFTYRAASGEVWSIQISDCGADASERRAA